MVSFLNHIASILYERGLTCGAAYPLYTNTKVSNHIYIKPREVGKTMHSNLLIHWG